METDTYRLQEKLADLCRFAMKARAEESVTTLGKAIQRDQDRQMTSMLSQRQQIDGPYRGVAYAVVQIGEVLAATIGFGGMCDLRDHIEEHVGEREAEWLNRRWIGIEFPDGSVWSD